MTVLLPLPAGDRGATDNRQLLEPATGCTLCLFDDLFLLVIDRLTSGTAPTTLKLGSIEIPGPFLSAQRGERHFLAGPAPSNLASVISIPNVTLTSTNQREVLCFPDRPAAILRGAAAAAEVKRMLGAGDRIELAALILRVLATFSRSQTARVLASTVIEAAETAQALWTCPLDTGHRYLRFAIASSAPGPLGVNARAYLLGDHGLTQLSAGRILISGGSGHLVLPGLANDQRGVLAVLFGDVILRVPVEPQHLIADQSGIEAVVAERPADGAAIKSFLLSRCADLLRQQRAPAVQQLGNLAWSQTSFPHRAFVRPDMDFGISIEHLLSVPDKGVLVVGWLWDPGELLDRLVIVDGQGRHCAIEAPLHRCPRPDVRQAFPSEYREQPGFMLFQPLPAADDQWPTFQVKARLKAGLWLDLGTDLKATKRAFVKPDILLNLIPGDRLTGAVLRDLAPAVAHLQRQAAARPATPRVVQFLEPPEAPTTSIVVPIYKRLDHARHQLAHFAADPDFAEIELIYVLDWPELENEFIQLLDGASRLYRRAVTLAVLPTNRGFAGATNAGAALARGRHLVLLNSDVIPSRPGWCRTLSVALDADRSLGAVGARLLYEDGTVQHAGMDYQRDARGFWKVIHPGKGLRVERPAGPVPGVTAACMMLPTDLYRSLQGLSEDYVIGDFEDSDLCLKLRATGKRLWYCPDAMLYHLERQSMGTDGRYNTSTWKYNQWLHEQRWSTAIARGAATTIPERLVATRPSISGAPATPTTQG